MTITDVQPEAAGYENRGFRYVSFIVDYVSKPEADNKIDFDEKTLKFMEALPHYGHSEHEILDAIEAAVKKLDGYLDLFSVQQLKHPSSKAIMRVRVMVHLGKRSIFESSSLTESLRNAIVHDEPVNEAKLPANFDKLKDSEKYRAAETFLNKNGFKTIFNDADEQLYDEDNNKSIIQKAIAFLNKSGVKAELGEDPMDNPMIKF